MDKDRDLVEEVFRSNMGSSRESVLECLELGVSLTIEDFQEGSEVFSLDLEFRVVTDMASGFGTIALALVATPRLIRRCRCGGDPSDFTESEITTRRTLLSFVAFVIKDFLRTFLSVVDAAEDTEEGAFVEVEPLEPTSNCFVVTSRMVFDSCRLFRRTDLADLMLSLSLIVEAVEERVEDLRW